MSILYFGEWSHAITIVVGRWHLSYVWVLSVSLLIPSLGCTTGAWPPIDDSQVFENLAICHFAAEDLNLLTCC
jgi:hypothetical protein